MYRAVAEYMWFFVSRGCAFRRTFGKWFGAGTIGYWRETIYRSAGGYRLRKGMRLQPEKCAVVVASSGAVPERCGITVVRLGMFDSLRAYKSTRTCFMCLRAVFFDARPDMLCCREIIGSDREMMYRSTVGPDYGSGGERTAPISVNVRFFCPVSCE